MKVLSLSDLQNGLSYLISHPDYLLRCILNAARGRVGIPLDAVHWLLDKLARGRLPSDLTLSSVPPGLRHSGTIEVMGTKMTIGATLFVDSVLLSAESLRVQLRVRELSIKVPPESPLAAMIAMMDLNKPGDLLNYMPVRPPIIVNAEGDLFVLDLMKLPKLVNNLLAQRIVAAVAHVLSIREFCTDGDLLVIGFRAMPQGLLAALGHLRLKI